MIVVNKFSYQLLQKGKIKDVIKLFKLNTIAYPESANAYDNFGEAYLKDG